MTQFKNIEAGKLPIMHESVDVKVVVESVATNYAHDAQEKGLQFDVSYAPNMPSLIESDKWRLTSIFKHLVDNAIKFTAEGMVRVLVNATRDDENNQISFKVQIEDTGIGIPEEQLKRIFTKFTRLDPSYKGRYEGKGLGLTITKHYLAELEGNIDVVSKEGCGTIVSFSFTADAQSGVEPVLVWHERYPDTRILIVDDSGTGDVITQQLGGKGVRTVNSHHVMHELAQSFKKDRFYDIIIVDDELKCGDPLTACRLIHSMRPEKAAMIVLLSKPLHTTEVKALKAHNIYDYVIKPFVPSEMTDKLSTIWKNFQER